MMSRSVAGPLMLAGALGLAACSGSSGGGGGAVDPGRTTDSRLVVLEQDGALPDLGIDPGNSVRVTQRTTMGGFAYQMGRVRGEDRFLGVAGIVPGARVGAAPTDARGTYRGDYSVAYADRSEFGDPASGRITLDADFNAGRLTGRSGDLRVDGTIAGQGIGGTATYRGVEADLTGRIGTTGAVGAFAGHTRDAVVTGGFLATRTD